MMKRLLLFLTLLLPFFLFSQTYRKYDYLKILIQEDSLKAKKLIHQELKRATTKEKAILYLLAAGQFDENVELFKSYIDKAKIYLKKEPENALEYGYYYNMLSVYYYRINDIDNYNVIFNISNSILVNHREYDALAIQYRNRCITTFQPELSKQYLASLQQYASKSSTPLSVFYYKSLYPYFLSDWYITQKKGNAEDITKLYNEAYQYLLIHQNEIPNSDKEFFLLGYANYLIEVSPKDQQTLKNVFAMLDALFKIYFDPYYHQMYITLQSDILMKQNKSDEAEQLLLLSIEKNKKISSQNSILVNEFLYSRLKNIAKESKEYDQFIFYDTELSKYHHKADSIMLKKSIYNAMAKAKVTEEEEKVRLLSEKDTFKNLLFISICIVFLLILFIIMLRWKINSKKNQSVLLENKRLGEEKMLQNKKLAELALQIEQKNEKLETLKTKMMEANYNDKKITQLIDDIFAINEDFEKFRLNFEYAHPDFFKIVQRKADNQLTNTDLRYLVYAFLNVSVKDIAYQMNVEPKSIHMARYRIKQKLKLAKEESLDDFIKTIVETQNV